MGDLDEVCNRLSEAWFPINPLALKRLNSQLQSDDPSMERIYEELKADASLFMFAVRELSKKLRHTEPEREIDPVQVIKQAEVESLRSLLNEGSGISRHEFGRIKPFQANVLRETVISATVSETLAPSVNLETDTAYACALLRQLGLALIAWNYPNVFAHAREKGEGRDGYLNLVLGFSPSLLGFTMARRWGLSSVYRRGMGDLSCPVPNDDPGAAHAGEALERICGVGEVLARAESTNSYPVARGEWEAARKTLEEALGPTAFHTLRERVSQCARLYVFSVPDYFTPPEFNGAYLAGVG